jgi:Cu(I)/Ag(I) efflux system membrane fusion protein
MSNRIVPNPDVPNGNGPLAPGALPNDQENPRDQQPRYGFWHNLWQVAKTVQARLRFIVLLAAVGGVLLYWDTLLVHYEKWTRPLLGEAAAAGADTEFWCPMHPTIVRDHPDKCPICGMPLSKRKKGEGKEATEALPPGVVSRVQLTPYRVALAGVETVAIDYQPLSKEINAVGFVEFDERRLARISARVTGKSRIDKLYVNVTGQTVHQGDPLATLYSPDLVVSVQNLLDARRSGNRDLERLARDRLRLWGIAKEQIDEILRTGEPITQVTIRSPMSGHVIRKYQVEGEYVEEGARLYDVADLSTVWVEAQVYEDEVAFLQDAVEKKLPVTAATKAFPDREFKGTVAFIHPHLDASTRTLKVRFDMDNPRHELRPGMYASVTLQVPVTRMRLLPPDAGEEQRRAFEKGLVLAVPERAVIDTGGRKVVYREAEPDVYEGVEVQLGPRCGAFYPVIKGLRAGDRVATAGSFLIDAETRLTAGAGSTYFGASAGPQGGEKRSATTAARPSLTRDEEDTVNAVLAKLNPEDRRLVEAQGYCPVLTDNRLGSMGTPVKVMVKGQPVFTCCNACVNKALSRPEQTLAKVEELRTKSKTAPPSEPKPPAVSGAGGPAGKDAKVKAALAKLSAEDRPLAAAQGFCPESGKPLGSMGVPVKVLVKGQPVFLCCQSCEDEAREHPDQTLTKVEELKAKVKASVPPM